MRSQEESGAKRPLLESEELFRFALEISDMGVWELSLQDHTARRTLEHDRIFGYDQLLPVWTYETFLHHVLPEDRADVQSKFEAALKNESDWRFECRIRRADGHIRWIWAAGRHKRTDAGDRYMAGVVQDVTTRKVVELRLLESQGRLKAIMEAAPIGVSYSDDASCERITGNRALLEQFEIDATDNISASTSDPGAAGRRVRIYQDGQEVEARELPLQKAVTERRQIGPVELEIVLPSGRRWVAQSHGAPILDEHGEALGGVAVTVDITQRRANEEALRRSERQERQHAAELKALLDTAPIGVALALDPSGENIRGNRANEEMFGLDQGAQFSMRGFNPPPLNMFQGGRCLRTEELPMQRALRGEIVANQIIDVRREDGRVLTVLAKATPLRDENGDISGAVGAFLDITALTQAQSALRKSEALLKQALDAADAGVWESVPETGEFRASDRALALHGLPQGTALTYQLALAAVHPNDRARIEAAVERSVSTGAPFRVELRSQQPDGSIRWLSSMAEARREDGKIRLVGLVQDVTERKRIEESLIEKEQRLSLALSAGRLATWDWDPMEERAIWNDEAFDLFGYRADETKAGYAAWAARIHPDDRQRVEGAFAKAVAVGGEFSDQYRLLLPDGSVKWVEARGRMERKAGRTVRSYGVLIDTTERKRAEEALREADRRKDEFLATLAHELRNPLAPIRNAVYVLRRLDKDEAGARHKAKALLGMVERQVEHLVRLVDDLLEVSRITTGKIILKKEPVDLMEVLAQALQTSEPHIRAHRHKVRFFSCDGPLVVEGDPVRLAQVFTNLLNNAAKYTPAGGNISLSPRREGADAVVTVEDDGIGILPEMMPRIFDLFVQSKRVTGREGGGIGVGLALSRRLVEMHGGHLDGRSEGADRGSAFIVRLPLTSLTPQRRRGGHETAENDMGRQRALVVDDDKDVADSLALLLDHLGARTRVVYGGEAALRAIDDFRPQVVFLDLGMPGMDGFETARAIKSRTAGAGVKLIALTGWGQSADRARTRAAGFELHLTKPASAEEVQAILASASGGRRDSATVESSNS